MNGIVLGGTKKRKKCVGAIEPLVTLYIKRTTSTTGCETMIRMVVFGIATSAMAVLWTASSQIHDLTSLKTQKRLQLSKKQFVQILVWVYTYAHPSWRNIIKSKTSNSKPIGHDISVVLWRKFLHSLVT